MIKIQIDESGLNDRFTIIEDEIIKSRDKQYKTKEELIELREEIQEIKKSIDSLKEIIITLQSTEIQESRGLFCKLSEILHHGKKDRMKESTVSIDK